MYTEQELKDAIICAVSLLLDGYNSVEEAEEAVNSLADNKVREIVKRVVVVATMYN